VAVGAVSLAGVPGVAQDRSAGAGALEEILVTARKREESLQDIPLVVNAVTAEQIERSTLQGLGDLSLRTPGLNYEGYVSAGLSGGLVLRGLTNTQLTNRTQNVAVFYDGVYLPNQAMFDLGLVDIERVEVLKGPQSALYGRNAFAGAVNYISRRPSNEWRTDAAVTTGSDDRLDYSAFVSGPLTEGRTMFKLAYARSEFDGTIGNNHPNAAVGVSPGNRGKLGGYDTEVYAAGLTLQPIDRLEIDLGYFRTDIVREPAGNYALQGAASNLFGLTNSNDLNCLPRSIGPGVTRNTAWCGELPHARPQAAGDTRLPGIVVDPRQLGLNGSSAIRTATARYDITEQLELFYEFGRADYSGIGGGPSDRDPIKGSNVQFLVGSPFRCFATWWIRGPMATCRRIRTNCDCSRRPVNECRGWRARTTLRSANARPEFRSTLIRSARHRSRRIFAGRTSPPRALRIASGLSMARSTIVWPRRS
jgi:iron complex outermembrane receptor protein